MAFSLIGIVGLVALALIAGAFLFDWRIGMALLVALGAGAAMLYFTAGSAVAPAPSAEATPLPERRAQEIVGSAGITPDPSTTAADGDESEATETGTTGPMPETGE